MFCLIDLRYRGGGGGGEREGDRDGEGRRENAIPYYKK